jgi:ubiquinone/menaquinone biosynthesis C-methylase UbiE
MPSNIENQKEAIQYYDKFAKIYDWVSSKSYYKNSREYALNELDLKPNQAVLNIPCGTGQNFIYFQKYLSNTGTIIGLDLSTGMLKQAQEKKDKNQWDNIKLLTADATKVNVDWINSNIKQDFKFDSILCDLGLSGFPDWEQVIDNLLSLLKPNGKIVIMDWYIDGPSLRGSFIKWVGKGEVNRPIYQYLENKVNNFKLNNTFKSGQMFVVSGTRKG